MFCKGNAFELRMGLSGRKLYVVLHMYSGRTGDLQFHPDQLCMYEEYDFLIIPINLAVDRKRCHSMNAKNRKFGIQKLASKRVEGAF